MKKSILSALLALTLIVAGFAGCSGSTPSSSAAEPAPAANPGEAAPAAEPAAEGEAASDLEPVELSMYFAGDPPEDMQTVLDAVNEKMKEKLNVTLSISFSTWTDYQQKYLNELTTGTSDIVFAANWFNYGQLATQGAFLELEELLPVAAPALDAAIEGQKGMMTVAGSLYAIPNLWPEYVSNGVFYREDLRAKYDLPRPDSLENAEAYFQGIKDNEPDQPIMRPTTEGSQGVQIGFDAASILNLKYDWVAVNGLPYGLAASYSTPSDVTDYWYSQDFIDDCKLMKSWLDKGFWSRSALADTNDTDAYQNGLMVLMMSGRNPSKHIDTVNAFAALHPDWINEFITYGEVNGAIWPGHSSQNATAIARGCENPERALQVIEYIMMDEEMNKLFQCGIEGTHYTIDADGIYHNVMEDQDPQDFPYEGFSSWALRNTEFKLLQKTDIMMNEMVAKYDALAAKTKFPRVNIYEGFTENYESYNTERSAVTNVIRQYLAPLQAGMVDDVDAAVAEFLAQAEAAGLQTCRDNYKEQWLAYCTEHNYI